MNFLRYGFQVSENSAMVIEAPGGSTARGRGSETPIGVFWGDEPRSKCMTASSFVGNDPRVIAHVVREREAALAVEELGDGCACEPSPPNRPDGLPTMYSVFVVESTQNAAMPK